ncbi:peroxidase isoform X2 [Anabrus simplex]
MGTMLRSIRIFFTAAIVLLCSVCAQDLLGDVAAFTLADAASQPHSDIESFLSDPSSSFDSFFNKGLNPGLGDAYHAQPQASGYGFTAQPGYESFFKGFASNGGAQCGPVVPGVCNKEKYRSIDGSCNNLKNPGWGMPRTTYNRVKPAKYGDGVQHPPLSVSGKPLASARLISYTVFPNAEIPDKKWTLAAMQYGQIITHDMSMALGTTQAQAHPVQCCTQDGAFLPKQNRNPSCFPIEIPPHDPDYGKSGQQCMNFVRTSTDLSMGCSSGFKPAEQLTAVTHYLDGSFIYGSDENTARSLRAFKGGKLIVEYKHGRAFPPTNPNATSACDLDSHNDACYIAGDVRVNQNTQLTVLHILYLREHNRVAHILQHINPHWDDEKVYQEARRIVVAEHQFISYYEWLPIFLGPENSRRHGLIYDTHGYTHDYDEHVDPSVINGHATAAFRYFHTNIVGFLKLVGEHRESYGALRLSDHMNKPQVIEEHDNYDDLLRGLSTQPEQDVDQHLSKEITNFLFRRGKPLGLDLRSFDIQRSRDHGLASYNDYRHFCGIPRAHHFSDFADLISEENINKLMHLYEHPDDVEFVVAASLEKHVENTLAGPTFLCVLIEQFFRTRVGDRFFFENGEKPQAFTLDQLNEIRKSSLSRVMCDNGDSIKAMQPRAFELISHDNFVVPCHRYDIIPAMNLEAWRDTPHHYKK